MIFGQGPGSAQLPWYKVPVVMRAGFVLLATLIVTPVAQAKPIVCQDPSTDEEVRVKVPRIQRALKSVKKGLKRRGIHLLDLPTEAQDRRRRLPQDLAAKDWCVVRSHVIAFEDALAMTTVDQGFVSEKFSRIERWVRALSEDAESPDGPGRLVANAAAAIADNKPDKANKILNRALAKIFGSSDLWRMPETLPEATSKEIGSASSVKISSYDVAAACPVLAKRGRAKKDELESKMDRLGALMDERKIRPLDLRGGEALINDLHSYTKLSAHWPATRVACYMINLITELEIGMGVVTNRFNLARRMRQEMELSPDEEKSFKTHVRSASDQIAARQFEGAHLALDELLVLLGRPSVPSSSLP